MWAIISFKRWMWNAQHLKTAHCYGAETNDEMAAETVVDTGTSDGRENEMDVDARAMGAN